MKESTDEGTGVRVYLPTEPWPDHPKPWFRVVFKKARDHGWTLRKLSDHNGYRLVCPNGSCQYPVFSTGKDGESAAKTISKDIEHCPHHAPTIAAVAVAEELLDKAERLINGLDAILVRDRVDQRSQELLADPDRCDEDEIYDLWAEVERLTGEASVLLEDLAGSEADEVFETTGSLLADAGGILKPLPPRNQAVKAQTQRLGGLRARCDELRKFSGEF
jgi:hypothetical protein